MATKRVCAYCGKGLPRWKGRETDIPLRAPDSAPGPCRLSTLAVIADPPNCDCSESIDTCLPCLIKLLQEAKEKENK